MISSRKAIALICENCQAIRTIRLSVNESLHWVVARDIYSPIDMPPFNQSAMDGYAIHQLGHDKYELKFEMKAGDEPKYRLTSNDACRIYTGAMIPEGTIAIIKQEGVIIEGNQISFQGEKMQKGQNIRPQGEQVIKGSIAIKENTLLTPGIIGYLATLGIQFVDVYQKPRITLIVTGNELKPPGSNLLPGQIYESNSVMVKTALETEGIVCSIELVEDNLEKTKESVRRAMHNSDIIIATGGISVGDYDFVYQSFIENGVEDLFYKVAQKPGKPLYVGKRENTLFFGLPGNPAAALTCLYLYVIPALRSFQNRVDKELIRVKGKLNDSYIKNSVFRHHLKAYYNQGSVTLLPQQSSAMLGSFAEANSIAIMQEDKKEWKIGDEVEVVLLP